MDQRRDAAVKRRSAAIDTVRVVGIVAIVTGHVWATTDVGRVVYPWHVPLFFFLSGYLWSDRSLSVELAKRAASLLRPYIVWFAVVGVLYVGWLVREDTLGLKTLGRPAWGGAVAGRPFTTFWFVSVLFFACLLYRAISGLDIRAQVALAAVGLIAGYAIGDLLAKTPLAIGSAWPCVSLMMAGAFASRHREQFGGAWGGCAAVGLGAIAVASGVSDPLDIKAGDYGTPVVSLLVAVMICSGMVLIAQILFAHVPAVIGGVVTRLAAAGFVVVLLHPVVLWMLGTPRSGGWEDFALALAAPWVVGLVAAQTAAAGWLTGNSNQPNGAGGKPATWFGSHREIPRDI